MPLVQNPILPGFNPDPSIIRVGKDYYIATSTFEWFPGVQIHHSQDLANWELITRPLTRQSQLDMRGDPDSGGVWAPCLSHDGKKFWLVYTDVKRKDGSFWDLHNYVINAPAIEGPWSDPIRANSSGIDPSLFHDDDGRKWFVNQFRDHRKPPHFCGIVLQEFDPIAGRLIGPQRKIFDGTRAGITEGPHIFKRNGWYYLLTAEGGTGYNHACTLARSRDIWGPYEVHPDRHILTAKGNPSSELQRAGHGDLVETPDGTTYLVHIVSRSATRKRSVLGRETAIQQATWADDDWLYVKNGPTPSLHVEVPGAWNERRHWKAMQYTFEEGLPNDFQWLRTPEPARIFSTGNALTLYGREAIGSWFEQALVARRQTHFSYNAETKIQFAPTNQLEFAGLTAYYSRYNFFYLTVTAEEDGQKCLSIMSSEKSWPEGALKTPLYESVSLPDAGKVKLAVKVRGADLQFYFSVGENVALSEIGPTLDASTLSDECGCGARGENGSFTGAFVGVACSDLNGNAKSARFDYFTYEPVQ
ncbi:glycoside hydrolase family 43 protein [Corynespora cassiicola Philippines]|uniref:Glycoside hydrolase family 43 protein n=1 Tax=Corynespora cassiicola Philippines TaxID=1448308 RepID=A0A2T2N5I5_CORCC|nr:glycoside hydrolase family 43 protein [Corynespora cassiicola Philippines]